MVTCISGAEAAEAAHTIAVTLLPPAKLLEIPKHWHVLRSPRLVAARTSLSALNGTTTVLAHLGPS